MKKYLLFLTFGLLATGIQAQVCRDLAVEVWAEALPSLPGITIKWQPDSNFQGYRVYRMNRGATAWGSAKATLPKTASEWTDSTAKPGEAYEYQVRRNAGSNFATGFVYAGLAAPPRDFRGRLLLLVEKEAADSLQTEIDRLAMDIRGDGWMVHRAVVNRQDPVDTVKQRIIDLYNLYPTELKTVFLLGRVPVPYSGVIAPDGHPDHNGAWPADGYYGDVLDYDGNWSDVIRNTTTASRNENKNTPGDGKFDQNLFPTDVELEIGRVDMTNMPIFGETEIQLLRLYLEKDHNYRRHITKTQSKAVIDDNFGYMGGEAFASNAWRHFPPLVGQGNYEANDYFGMLRNATDPYIWSYGTGGGHYQGAGGVGTTDSFDFAYTGGIFTQLFGSYFGDWDSYNNFLRAPLAAPKSTCLTNAWVGRPWWTFHHMGLGENIGAEVPIAQNSPNLFTPQNSYFSTYVHIALMGDPSLRMYPLDPVDAINTTTSHGGAFVNLSWDASTDAVAGYHLYRSDSLYGKYYRITQTPVTGTTYTDARPNRGKNCYMVRATRLENTPSGTFYNMSEGTFTAALQIDSIDWQGLNQPETLSFSLYPNPASGVVTIFRPNPASKPAKLRLYDAAGRLVKIVDIPSGSEQQINLDGLQPGVYLAELTGENANSRTKLVVSRKE